MRALLVTNPAATTTSSRMHDVIVSALRGARGIELEVVTTTGPGAAKDLGIRAREEGFGVVMTFGGDGTVHEVVNGLLAAGPGPDVPALAPVPGGSANVLTRALGLMNDPIEATGQVLEALATGRSRTIGLGRANDEWFTVNAGLGLDAEIIHAMEDLRAKGRSASPLRYLTTTLSQFLKSDRKSPRLTLTTEAGRSVRGIYLVIVQNTTPWTYLGPLAVSASPRASFDLGLDAWCAQNLSTAQTLTMAAQMLRPTPMTSRDGRSQLVHDSTGFTITASSPVPWQIDGEARPAESSVHFSSVARALRVIV